MEKSDIGSMAHAYVLAARLNGARIRLPEPQPEATDLFSVLMVAMLEDWTRVQARQAREVASEFGSSQNRRRTITTSAHRALILEMIGDFDEAERAYRQARLQTNRGAHATLLYGAFLERRGRDESAETIYREFIEQSNSASFEDPEIAAALERVEADRRAPRLPRARNAAARALYLPTLQLVSQAPRNYVALYMRIIQRLDPEFARNQLSLAQILRDLEMNSLAIATYDQIDSGPFASLAEIQSIWLTYRDTPSDERTFDVEALTASAQNSEVKQVLLADILRISGDCPAALDIYERVLTAYEAREELPDSNLPFFAGLCWQNLNDWPRAEAHYLHALHLEPTSATVLNHLGYNWIVQGDRLEEGVDLVRRAMRADPENGNIIDSLGWGYFKQGQYDEAVTWLELAAEKEPSNATINWHLGDAYAAVGRELEARFQWQRALEQDADDAEIELINRRLELGLDAGPADLP